MTARNPSPVPGWTLALLLLLFIGSGFSALVYEIVWFQMLRLVVGSSAVSLGALLTAYMGGMCLGSLLLPRWLPERLHPLRVYAALELGIGVSGAALLLLIPAIGALYTTYVPHGAASVLMRGGVAVLCLLPPTFLMGATLPAVARWVRSTPQGVARLGFFYGANLAGAVAGCLIAGFYLLRVYDVNVATGVAVVGNLLVAGVSFALAAWTPAAIDTSSAPANADEEAASEPPATSVAIETGSEGSQSPSPQSPSPQSLSPETTGGSWDIYAAIFLSGTAALGAEVVWTRQLSLMMGATTYMFSVILAVFLIGLGIGSSAGSLLARWTAKPRRAFGLCQLLAAGAIVWAATALANWLPYWSYAPEASADTSHQVGRDLLRSLLAMIPATLLWGASFPLALACAAGKGGDPGRLVGGVYAANTVGAIAGAIGFSLFSIRFLGSQGAQQLLVVLSGAAALLVLLMTGFRHTQPSTSRPIVGVGARAVALAALVVAAVWLVPATPRGLIAYGRQLPAYLVKPAHRFSSAPQLPRFLYVGEGVNASIAVSEFSDAFSDGGIRNFHVSGKVVASAEPKDMRLQRLLGNLPALMHRRPESILVVGCGAGVTGGCFVAHPHVKRIVFCEIESLIPPAAAEYFARENQGVFADPRVEVIHDDARHFIATTRERFDIITSDPIHPWVKGAAALYSREFFQLCKQRLKPGGLVTQWVPLYESNRAAVQCELATFFDVFPSGTIWSNDIQGAGYDVVVLGSDQPLTIDIDQLQARLERPDHRAVLESLEAVKLGSALKLAATYAGRGEDLREWLQGTPLNLDRNLRLQYLAGLSLNTFKQEAIYAAIRERRTFPSQLLTGKPATIDALRKALSR